MLMDQGIYIDMVVNSVINNMLSGAVLAILVLLLFLKSDGRLRQHEYDGNGWRCIDYTDIRLYPVR